MQQLQLIGIDVALAYLYFRQSTAGDITAADLQLCRQLLLGQIAIFAKSADILPQCLLNKLRSCATPLALILVQYVLSLCDMHYKIALMLSAKEENEI